MDLILPDPELVLAFALTSVAVELTPGPNMTWLAILSLQRGQRAGLTAVAGVALGLAIVGLAAGLGLTIAASPVLYQALRWAGFVFILYLAWDAWKSADTLGAEDAADVSKHFQRGVLTNLLNPKAAAFYLVVMPGFMQGGTWQEIALLTTIYVAIATGIHAGIVVMADRARGILTNSDRARPIAKGLALGLVGVAVWILLKT
jgi:threonine/homoserine/homoserine lactone efflux protein